MGSGSSCGSRTKVEVRSVSGLGLARVLAHGKELGSRTKVKVVSCSGI